MSLHRRCEGKTCRGETIPGIRLAQPVTPMLLHRGHGFPVEGALLCGNCARPPRPARAKAKRPRAA